jgi:SNF2 family DNA or RNA helicase
MSLCAVVLSMMNSIRKSCLDPKSSNSEESESNCLVSLIVCPSTVVLHWIEEINKFFPYSSKESNLFLSSSFFKNISNENGDNNCLSKKPSSFTQFPVNLKVTGYIGFLKMLYHCIYFFFF